MLGLPHFVHQKRAGVGEGVAKLSEPMLKPMVGLKPPQVNMRPAPVLKTRVAAANSTRGGQQPERQQKYAAPMNYQNHRVELELPGMYPMSYQQPGDFHQAFGSREDSKVEGESSVEESSEEDLVDENLREDPVPYLAPKSKKMALGSITFTAEQGRELGVMTKDNSFFLRVEKCDPIFCDRLHFQVEQMHGIELPRDVEDPCDYWPEGALNRYCQKPSSTLQREMDRVYRMWHDQRCGMEQLFTRLCYLKNTREA